MNSNFLPNFENAAIGAGGIDLSKLPPPKLIEELSYEEIKSAMVAKFNEMMATESPNYKLFESDPAMKVIEVSAYREMILRQRVNDAAKECMLAFSEGTNLEHIAALFNVSRDVLIGIDPETRQPRKESDRSLRSRTLLAFERFSTAGAFAAYIYQAKKVGTALGLHDVLAYSPKPGYVNVTLLWQDYSNVEVLETGLAVVKAHLEHRDVKPLTDILTVDNATIRDVVVKADLKVPFGVDTGIIHQRAVESLSRYANERFRVGADIPVSGLHHALFVANVIKVSLIDFPSDFSISESEAPRVIVNEENIKVTPGLES